MRLKLIVVGLLSFLVATLGVAGTAAASTDGRTAAASHDGALAGRMTPVSGVSAAAPSCPYPYVCFYKNGTRTGSFKDVTTYYQNLTASRAADEVYNTRNDDVAWLRWEDGVHTCVEPHGWYFLQTSPHYVTGIKIRPENNCSVET